MNPTPNPLSHIAGLSPPPTGRERTPAVEETQRKAALSPCCAHVCLGITQAEERGVVAVLEPGS